jgi:hypothetical protein
MKPESITDIRAPDVKEQLHLTKGRQELRLGSMKTLYECIRFTEQLTQTVGTSIRLRKMIAWALWRESAPPKQKKSLLASSFRVEAIDAGALITLVTIGRTNRRKMMVIHLDQLAALRREQRERLESKHRVNGTASREMRPLTDVHSTVL